MDIQDAEKIVKNGKTLLEWAKTDPLKLEKILENEFDKDTQEAITLVYRVHVMGHNN